MSLARSMTIASSSSDGCTTGATSRRSGAIWPPGSQNGGGKYPKLTSWVEENIEETLTYFRLPLAQRRHMKSTDEMDKQFL
ncbi:hypothetical protein XH97_02410 [Bradyrhizobium sp. CCBAU 53380]|nr:hypothetical protein [Bradyrhizobium sp. CCBAU 53380]